MQNKITVVIPALNEENNIGLLVETLVGYGFQVIVVDDNSSDETRHIANKSGAYVIHNNERLGIAKSLLKGFDRALQVGSEWVASIDCESHSPETLVSMLTLRFNYDLIIGSRFEPFSVYDNTNGKWFRPYVSWLAAKVLNFSQHRSNVSDWTSGFRIYSASLLKSLLQHKYFSKMHGIQIETLGRTNELGANIFCYPITYKSGKSSFNFEVLNECIRALLFVFFHYKSRPKYKEIEIL